MSFDVGDRVKVSFETTVTAGTGACICTDPENGISRKYLEAVENIGGTVEKVKPPVEFFRHGIVTNKRSGGTYFINEYGWINLNDTEGSLSKWNIAVGPDFFTSEYYERVNLDDL